MRAIVLASTALVLISAPALAAPKQSFAIYDATAAEEAGKAPLKICKVGANQGTASDVHLNVVGSSSDTAKAASDFTAIEDMHLAFDAASLCQTVDLILTNDSVPESSEFVTATITAGKNARLYDGKARITIPDGDPKTQTCPDGSVIAWDAVCPAPPPPPMEHPSDGGYLLTADVKPITDADIGFDPALGTKPVAVLPLASPGSEGFRFTCGLAKFAYDDPIVFPGQPGKSHLHQLFGNTSANAYSTRESLAKTGGSTCNYVATGTNGKLVVLPYALNRSAYWIPAFLDGSGYANSPDYITVYYKGPKIGAASCGDPRDVANKKAGFCLPGIPNGLKMVWGSDFKGGFTLNQRTDGGRQMYFNCSGTGSTPGKYADLEAAKPNCVVGGKIGIIVGGPDCTDGKHSDVPDHRSHVAYSSYGSWGYARCPLTHAYRMPHITLQYWYTVTAEMLKPGYAGAYLSSDDMDRSKNPGWSLHGDYWEAWHTATREKFEGPTGCIGAGKNCSAGNLGQGEMLTYASQPIYDGLLQWTNPVPRVPVPDNPHAMH